MNRELRKWLVAHDACKQGLDSYIDPVTAPAEVLAEMKAKYEKEKKR